MGSVQTLSEAERRIVAMWAADCAERVLPLFEAEARTMISLANPSLAHARSLVVSLPLPARSVGVSPAVTALAP